MRKELPLLLTVLMALLVIFSYYSFHLNKLDILGTTDKWITISMTAAVLIGTINLTRVQATNVIRRKEGWYNSLILLIVLYGYMILGLIQGLKGAQYDWLFQNVWVNCDSSMFSILAFYIASAAYRAFRVRSKEATVLLVAGIIVMLGNVPLGNLLWNQIPLVRNWIMEVGNAAPMRGILLGAYIGAFAVALRILLGIERAHLGGGN